MSDFLHVIEPFQQKRGERDMTSCGHYMFHRYILAASIMNW
jgi:hypothetical protein